MKKLLIIIVIAIVVFVGASLAMKNSSAQPGDSFYFFKSMGEWFDLNFLTIGSPDKQAKHLYLADRRFQEIRNLTPTLSQEREGAKSKYQQELASAYFMAEQLALIDHKFIPLLENVYLVTLDHLGSAKGVTEERRIECFDEIAQFYNQKAIKELLQKHQHSEELTAQYTELVEKRLEYAGRLGGFTQEQNETLNKAKTVLTEGIEIEWAYDLLVSLEE